MLQGPRRIQLPRVTVALLSAVPVYLHFVCSFSAVPPRLPLPQPASPCLKVYLEFNLNTSPPPTNLPAQMPKQPASTPGAKKLLDAHPCATEYAASIECSSSRPRDECTTLFLSYKACMKSAKARERAERVAALSR